MKRTKVKYASWVIAFLLSLAIGFVANSQSTTMPETQYKGATLPVINAGSCASPDGVTTQIAAPPADYQYLEDNGYCLYSYPTTSEFTACFSVTVTTGNIDFNAGNSASCVNTSFGAFTLFDNTCTQVGTGLSYTGLSPGEYVWCLNMRAFGGPVCNGFDAFCPYYIESSVLPIELIYLRCDDHHIVWGTASEINNQEFNIYSATDTTDWVYRASIEGAGNSNTDIHYEYADYNTSGDMFYKIEQVDFDGIVKDVNIVFCEGVTDPPRTIVEAYDMLGRPIPIDSKGFKILKIQEGDSIYFEKIFTQ
jgi:hypothetical protein